MLVIGQLFQHIGHEVCWREDFKDCEWRLGDDLIPWRVAAEDSDVWDAVVVYGYLNTQLGIDADIPGQVTFAELTEKSSPPGSMIEFPHCALLDSTMDVFAVGIRGGS